MDDIDALFASAQADAKAEQLTYEATSHFHRDFRWIVAECQRDVQLFPGIVAFVLLTIRQQFTWMPLQVADVAKHGTKSRFMFGWKPEGFMYARAYASALHNIAVRGFNGDISLEDVILAYMDIPGLGVAKASFLVQMTIGDGACLDTVNIQRLGLAWDAFRTPKSLKSAALRAKIRSYNAVWQAHGNTTYWWDSWCEALTERKTINTGRYRSDGSEILRGIAAFPDAAAASAVHRLAITGGIR